MGRGRGAGTSSIPGIQYSFEPGRGRLAVPDIHQASDDISYHEAQEAVGGNLENDDPLDTFHEIRLSDAPDRMGSRTSGTLERAEIMFSQEVVGGLLHGGRVQRSTDEPDMSSVDGRG